MQGQSRFKPQRVSRTETRWSHACINDCLPKFFCVRCGDSNFYAVFPGVTRASDHDIDAIPRKSSNIEARHGGNIWVDRFQQRSSLRTLHREDGSFRSDIPCFHGNAAHGVGDFLDRPGDPIGIRCVRHHVERLRIDPPDDDVVNHRCCLFVEQVGVLRTTRGDPIEVIGESALKHLERIGTGDSHRS